MAHVKQKKLMEDLGSGRRETEKERRRRRGRDRERSGRRDRQTSRETVTVLVAEIKTHTDIQTDTDKDRGKDRYGHALTDIHCQRDRHKALIRKSQGQTDPKSKGKPRA